MLLKLQPSLLQTFDILCALQVVTHFTFLGHLIPCYAKGHGQYGKPLQGVMKLLLINSNY